MNNFKAGTYRQNFEYKSFVPTKINHAFDITDKDIMVMIEEAGIFLGTLEAFSQLVPDIDLFIEMHIYKEATLSSRIEGTQTTFEEAVNPKEIILPEQRDDWTEIQNYIKAINYAKEALQTLPISMRLINETHAVLLSGARGEHKTPGEIRKSQNWIGGSNLKDAFFIPPHQEDLPELLSDLEKFWHNKTLQIPLLVKMAIFHYQFETIHPFCDGNGRMGRLLIPLMLMSENKLSKPSLYASDFFERNKASYYDSLTMVRQTGDISQWIKFFLSAIIETGKKATATLKHIVEYKKEIDEKIMTLGARAKVAEQLVRKLFSSPVINTQRAAYLLNCSYGKANRLIAELETLNIVTEKTKISRVTYYELKDYLKLFK